MAYDLEAILGSETVLNRCLDGEGILVRLSHGVGMIPLVASVLEALSLSRTPKSSLAPSILESLSQDIERFGMRLSNNGPLGYVEAHYFGGPGFQSAVVWDRGQIVLGPTKSGPTEYLDVEPINRVLRLLGVIAADGHDEFDTIGLGRCRRPEKWLKING